VIQVLPDATDAVYAKLLPQLSVIEMFWAGAVAPCVMVMGIDDGEIKAELGVHPPPLPLAVTERVTFPPESTIMLPKVYEPLIAPEIVTVAPIAVAANATTINTGKRILNAFIFSSFLSEIPC